jgi:O-methyltransferase involved in polyketide biosynthesis
VVDLLCLLRPGPESISPTAHYTGYVWAHHGLGPTELATYEGMAMYAAMLPANWASAVAGGPTLPDMLLARHRRIDDVLTRWIRTGEVSQVVEVAAGMSPRGYRFSQAYGPDRLTYVEADLPGMSARKRQAMRRLPDDPAHHRFASVDALQAGGPGSLEELLSGLDKERGVAVVTEGLVNYLPTSTMLALWTRLAELLSAFPAGVYVSDIVPPGAVAAPLERLATTALGLLVRSGTYLHFDDDEQTIRALTGCGFGQAQIHHPEDGVEPAEQRSARVVRVIEATTG